MLKLHLADAGYAVLLAEDAIVGGRLLLAKQPDLLIVDAGLPYLSGIDFVATLLADRSVPCPPVIFITGDDRLSYKTYAMGSACLIKPFLTTDLLDIVARCLPAHPAQAAGVRVDAAVQRAA